MPIPTKYVYVTTNYMGYLSSIKQFGPIVHPAKITEDEANALLLAGVDLVRHDPATKMTYHMSLTKKVEDHIDKIPEPIQETVLTGTPKSVGDFGISEQSKIEPKAHIDIAQIVTEQKAIKETTPVIEESKENVVATPIEEKEKQFKLPVESVIEDIQTGMMTEADVNFSDYTKSERRQIRAAINAKNAEVTESND